MNRVFKDRMVMGVIGAIFIVSLLGVVAITALNGKNQANASEREVDKTLLEAGFYPGRLYDEKSDYIFAFDEYLNYVGATDVQRYVYTNEDGTNYELKFKFDDKEWTLKTVEFRMPDDYSWGMYSMIEVKDGGVRFIMPNENSGTHICDASSPFKIDWNAFNVFHASTDANSVLTRELRAEVEESNCPFRGLGVAHYEIWEDGEQIWHDDAGKYNADNGLDLHY
jgi:hypothetical protein